MTFIEITSNENNTDPYRPKEYRTAINPELVTHMFYAPAAIRLIVGRVPAELKVYVLGREKAIAFQGAEADTLYRTLLERFNAQEFQTSLATLMQMWGHRTGGAAMKFGIYEGSDGWRWGIVKDDKYIATSDTAYDTREEAVAAIETTNRWLHKHYAGIAFERFSNALKEGSIT